MSVDPGLEAALFNVESIHHIHGQECLCGFKSAISRDRTKHIMAITLEAAVPSEDSGLLSRLSASGGRNIDLLKRAEAAEAKVTKALELANSLAPFGVDIPAADLRDLLGGAG
jgi:hypothetical protein